MVLIEVTKAFGTEEPAWHILKLSVGRMACVALSTLTGFLGVHVLHRFPFLSNHGGVPRETRGMRARRRVTRGLVGP